jgi:RNA polymerase sigma-70 factor (ECF subfamily)
MDIAGAKESYKQDVLLAQRVCDELRSDNKNAILGIYNIYHPFFLEFTRRRLYSPESDKVQTILTNFWVELLNAKAICDYEGRASLRNYLLKILKWRIIDNIRKNDRRKMFTHNSDDEQSQVEAINDNSPSPKQNLLKKERQKIIHNVLMILSVESPKDALLVKMHLDDLTYKEMAKQELSGMNYNEAELNKKINAIKKQFTRKGTGSLAKFKDCLERYMKKQELKYEDMFY